MVAAWAGLLGLRGGTEGLAQAWSCLPQMGQCCWEDRGVSGKRRTWHIEKHLICGKGLRPWHRSV